MENEPVREDANIPAKVMPDITNKETLPEAPKVEERKPEAVEEPPAEKPVQTPSNELYAALQEERARRKEMQRELESLREREKEVAESTQHSEEGLRLKKEIERLEGIVGGLQSDIRLKSVLDKHPALNEHLVEFDEYRQDYPGLPIDKVAMVFLAEKGALQQKVRRVGLEQPTGGPSEPPQAGLTVDDLKRMRTQEPEKYHKMLAKGQIKLSDIKRD